MKKASFFTAVLMLLTFALLPAGVFAEKPEIEPFLARLDSRKIKTTENSVVITDSELSKSGVAKVTFDDRELSIRIHYTVAQDGDSVIVRFKPMFLSRQEYGVYDVRVELAEHSAETTFSVGESNSDVALEPPKAASPSA